MKNRCLLVILLSAIFAPLAFAWGPTGHRVVAEIAQRHLTPTARKQIAELLGGYSLAEVANWADELRSDQNFVKYNRLHFATVPNGMKSYRETDPDPCGDLVAAIDALSLFLQTGSRDDLFKVKALTDNGNAKNACNPAETEPISRNTALRLLVHFMGDLSQPLHVGGADRGGNEVQVIWMKHWQTNLHSVWDDEMVDFERLDYLEYARFLDHVSEEQVARWQAGNTITWADEDVAMRSALYLFPDDKPKPPFAMCRDEKDDEARLFRCPLVSYGYTGAQNKRMNEQLLKGGLRLARLLNEIFVNLMKCPDPSRSGMHAAANPAFPHQSTSNQWFNESQTESYRMLGLHTLEEICRGWNGTGLEDFGRHMREVYLTGPPNDPQTRPASASAAATPGR